MCQLQAAIPLSKKVPMAQGEDRRFETYHYTLAGRFGGELNLAIKFGGMPFNL